MEGRDEELFLHVLLSAACAPVVICAIARGSVFDTDATICALLLLFAMYGFVRPLVRRVRSQRVPPARIHGDSAS